MWGFNRNKPQSEAEKDSRDIELEMIKENFKKEAQDVEEKTRKARIATEMILEAEKKGDGVLNTFLATGGDKRL